MADVPLSTVYEQLVRDIYQAIVDQALVETVEVQHNVLVQGRSGEKHQIDVYWEFGEAGFTQRVCIEVKAYSNPAKKDHVSAFYGKVRDIGEDVRGVFVCMAGFQSGAVGLAKYHGIALQTAHWVLRTIEVDLTLQAHPLDHIVELEPVLDKTAVRSILLAAGQDDLQFKQRLTVGDAFLWPTDGGSPQDLFAVVDDPTALDEGWHTAPATGLALKHQELGLLPLKAVRLKIRHPAPLKQQYEIRSPGDPVRAELRDVVQGWAKRLAPDGKLVVEE